MSSSIRQKLRAYRLSRQSLEAMRKERANCLNSETGFELDAKIQAIETELDRLLSCVMGITDGLAQSFIIEHFINGKTIYQVEIKFCYSREWVYKKIALGIRQIEEAWGKHD